MRRYNARLNDQGFTLLELLIVVIFAGVLAAIAAPSFLAMNQASQLNNDLASAEGAILEAQRGAMRDGKNCLLSFYIKQGTTYPVIDGVNDSDTKNSKNCLSTSARTLENVSMQVSTNNTNPSSITTISNTTPTTLTTPGLTFSFDGNLTGTANTTIVIQHKNNAGLKKCIVITYPLGLIGTGKYTGTSSTDISSNCTP